MNAPDSLKLRIEGMDCAACAVKIENAMKRLPGGNNWVLRPQWGGLLTVTASSRRDGSFLDR